MDFAPVPADRLARARTDLRGGLGVVLRGAADTLILAAETLTAGRLAALRELGAPMEIALTAWRARTLKARVYDGDLARIALPTDATVAWIRALADPADDLRQPMKGPLTALRHGQADAHRVALRLMKSARLLPAAVVVPLSEPGFAAAHDLTVLPLEEVGAILDAPPVLTPVAAARLPLALAGAGRLHVFRHEGVGEEHCAVEIGRPDRAAPVLARLHSACFTGDVLGSLKCDCGPQLHAALAQMAEAGAGILLYLNQEGRGIGLVNKMRAYSLQDQGFDTVEANHRLGFEDDERDFRLGAQILRTLGIGEVRLLTNNPAKVRMMEDSGVTVADRIPLKAGLNPLNEEYLDTKARKSGHLL